jgi:F0F1-type ATP synthase delta subunit
MKEIFEKLSERIITEEDLVFVLEQLDLIKEMVFKKPQVSLSEKLKDKIDDGLRKEIEKLEKEKIIPSLPEEQVSFFENFKNFLYQIPKARLEIAFEPSEEFIKKIEQWFKENLGKKIILDFTLNPKMVGGLKIEFQGKWKDYSLEKEIEKIYGGI